MLNLVVILATMILSVRSQAGVTDFEKLAQSNRCIEAAKKYNIIPAQIDIVALSSGEILKISRNSEGMFITRGGSASLREGALGYPDYFLSGKNGKLECDSSRSSSDGRSYFLMGMAELNSDREPLNIELRGKSKSDVKKEIVAACKDTQFADQVLRGIDPNKVLNGSGTQKAGSPAKVQR